MKDFNRDELIEMRDKAEDLATEEHLNETWRRAYLALADAADHLDAMWARAEAKTKKERRTK